MVGRSERALRSEFEARYRVRAAEVTHLIERKVIGGDWGANGYTTIGQADRLGRELGLSDGSLLLDVGSGRGWPGLYLAVTTGCRVVMTDVPVDALATAMSRARQEGVADRAEAAVSTARAFPFRPASFDAVVHTDVLC